MPQRHSKNNNYLAFFTYEERLKLGYGRSGSGSAGTPSGPLTLVASASSTSSTLFSARRGTSCARSVSLSASLPRRRTSREEDLPLVLGCPQSLFGLQQGMLGQEPSLLGERRDWICLTWGSFAGGLWKPATKT